jgi:hypothetical protein
VLNDRLEGRRIALIAQKFPAEQSLETSASAKQALLFFRATFDFPHLQRERIQLE